MATMTIALTRTAYERLKKQKLPGKSLADVCYYGQPVIDRDRAFNRARGLRRLAY